MTPAVNSPTNAAPRHRLPWLLIVAMALASLNYVLWLSGRDITTLESENAKHVQKAYAMSVEWRNGDIIESLNTRTYPPLSYVPAAALFCICDEPTETIALLSLLPFMVLGGVGIYGVGRHFNLSPAESASVALMLFVYESMSVSWSGFLTEHAVIACFTLALWAFFASDFLLRRNQSLLFALCCGLGLLCRWTFFASIAMVLPVVLGVLVTRRTGRRPRLINLGLSFAAIVLLALPWYGAHHYHGHSDDGSNFHELLTYYSVSQQEEVDFYLKRAATGQPNPNGDIFNTYSLDRPFWETGLPLLLCWLSQRIIPPHLLVLIFLGISVSAWSIAKKYSPRADYICLFLCLLFPPILVASYPSFQLFHPQTGTLRYICTSVPLALLITVISWPLFFRTRCPGSARLHLPLLLALNAITLVTAIGWFFPDKVHFYSSCWFKPTICGTDKLEFTDPCGLVTPPKHTAVDDVNEKAGEYLNRGYQLALVVSVHQTNQPLCTLLNLRYGDIDIATYEHGRWQYINCSSQTPTEPDPSVTRRPKIYIYQDHLRREDSPELLTREVEDNCIIDNQNLGLVHRLQRFNMLDESTAILVPRPHCQEVYYFSTHSPDDDPLRPPAE